MLRAFNGYIAPQPRETVFVSETTPQPDLIKNNLLAVIAATEQELQAYRSQQHAADAQYQALQKQIDYHNTLIEQMSDGRAKARLENKKKELASRLAALNMGSRIEVETRLQQLETEKSEISSSLQNYLADGDLEPKHILEQTLAEIETEIADLKKQCLTPVEMGLIDKIQASKRNLILYYLQQEINKHKVTYLSEIYTEQQEIRAGKVDSKEYNALLQRFEQDFEDPDAETLAIFRQINLELHKLLDVAKKDLEAKLEDLNLRLAKDIPEDAGETMIVTLVESEVEVLHDQVMQQYQQSQEEMLMSIRKKINCKQFEVTLKKKLVDCDASIGKCNLYLTDSKFAELLYDPQVKRRIKFNKKYYNELKSLYCAALGLDLSNFETIEQELKKCENLLRDLYYAKDANYVIEFELSEKISLVSSELEELKQQKSSSLKAGANSQKMPESSMLISAAEAKLERLNLEFTLCTLVQFDRLISFDYAIKHLNSSYAKKVTESSIFDILPLVDKLKPTINVVFGFVENFINEHMPFFRKQFGEFNNKNLLRELVLHKIKLGAYINALKDYINFDDQLRLGNEDPSLPKNISKMLLLALKIYFTNAALAVIHNCTPDQQLQLSTFATMIDDYEVFHNSFTDERPASFRQRLTLLVNLQQRIKLFPMPLVLSDFPASLQSLIEKLQQEDSDDEDLSDLGVVRLPADSTDSDTREMALEHDDVDPYELQEPTSPHPPCPATPSSTRLSP
jgi:uncharacterized protein YqfB (UPF0267 family)